MWIATEINLHHENTVKEAFNRQLAARNRRIFWDLNPSSPASWIYENYIDRFPEQFGDRYNYEHFTIRDNAVITSERFAEIEAQYQPGSIWYRRDILGERCNAEGLVYPMFDRSVNVVDEHKESADYWYISIDYGTLNPTAMELWRLEKGVATMEREYYYDGRKSQKQKTDEEYYSDLEDFAGDIPLSRLYIIIDPSAASFKATIRKHKKFHVQDANNSVLDGIRFTGTLIAQGKIKIHSSCKHTLDEFGLYRWDETKTEDTVIKENDHAMDAMRYMAFTLKHKFREQNNYIPLYARR